MSVEKWMTRIGSLLVPRMNFAAAQYGVSGPCCLDSQFGKLDGDLVYGSTATVSVWTDGSDSGDDIEDVELPPWATDGKLLSGSWVTIEKIDGKWYARFGHERRFELKDDLTGPGTATAYILNYNSSEDEYTIGAEGSRTEFELFDFVGFKGKGRVVDGEDVTDGTRGWCVEKDGRWEVIGGIGGGYDRISGLTTAVVTGGSFTIDHITVTQGANPLDDPESTSETQPISNPMTHNIDAGGLAFAEWNISLNGGAGGWQAYQGKCPSS